MPITPVTLSNGKEKRVVKVKHPEGATKDQIHAYALSSVRNGGKKDIDPPQVDQDVSSHVAPPPEPAIKSYQWSEIPGAAINNFPESVGKFYTGLGHAASHPTETGKTIKGAVIGGLVHADPSLALAMTTLGVDPSTIASGVEIASTIGGIYKNNYGSIDALKRTLAEDPVTALADLSTILGLGAGLPGKTGSIASMGSRFTNPMTPAVAVAKLPVKAAVKTGGIIKNALNPKYATYLAAMEGKGNEILGHLRDPNRVIVPGSEPTAAQAASPAGSARFSSLGREAEALLPSEYVAKGRSQDAARLAAVRSVGGDEAALEAAKSARKTTSGRFYNISDRQVIAGDDVLEALLDTPAGRDALRLAEKIAGNRRKKIMVGQWKPAGVSPPTPDPMVPGSMLPGKPIPAQVPKFTGEGLHDIKVALDGMINDPVGHGISSSQARSAMAVRADFLKWLEDKSSAYKAARTTHRKMSEPVNQMQVGQFLEKRLTNALAPEALDLRPTTFGTAMADAPGTIDKATGGASRFTKLEQVLTPDQMKLVTGVRDDLARELETAKLARAGSRASPHLRKAGTEAVADVSLPHVFTRAVVLLNDMLRRLKGQVNERVALEIATEMLDPDTAAAVIEKALARESRYGVVTQPATRASKAVEGVARRPVTGSALNAMSQDRERDENVNAYRR